MALTFFTDPYPDELLYSAFARFCERTNFRSKRDSIQYLLGTDQVRAVVDLPGHLKEFIERLPKPNVYTIDKIIEENTLMPVYSPFCPSERIKQIRYAMSSGAASGVHMRLGLMANRVTIESRLSYCVSCVEQDIEQFGEPYWHRIHQVSGVKICPKHFTWLKQANIFIHDNHPAYEFISAREIVKLSDPDYVEVNKFENQILLWIAEGLNWILNRPNIVAGPLFTHRQYIVLLRDRGFANHSGRVNVKELTQSFKRYYADDFLHAIDCRIMPHIQEHWLIRLARNKNTYFAPLQHLLLIKFLDCKVQDFFTHQYQYKPFGDAPYPCLNKICEDYGKNSITECSISFTTSDGKPTGIFQCDKCGFTYIRKGPDHTQEDKYRIGKITDFGSIWLEKLVSLTAANVGLREKSRQLGVDPRTVNLQTLKLNMIPCDAQPASTIAEDRDIWLALQQQYPHYGVKKLRTLHPDLYARLYRNDKEWLFTHQPASQKNQSPRLSRVNWHERDKKIASQVPASANQIRLEIPIRQITLSSIGKKLGQLPLLQQHIDKLPLTEDAVRKEVESREEYALRRIEWADSEFVREKRIPSKWELIKRAGVERLLQTPQIRDAISQVLGISI